MCRERRVHGYTRYVSPIDQALVNTRLYLPKEWADDRARRKAAGVPKQMRFQTRHQQALEMLEEQGRLLPHAWVAGETKWAETAVFAAICPSAASGICWPCPATRWFAIGTLLLAPARGWSLHLINGATSFRGPPQSPFYRPPLVSESSWKKRPRGPWPGNGSSDDPSPSAVGGGGRRICGIAGRLPGGLIASLAAAG